MDRKNISSRTLKSSSFVKISPSPILVLARQLLISSEVERDGVHSSWYDLPLKYILTQYFESNEVRNEINGLEF